MNLPLKVKSEGDSSDSSEDAPEQHQVRTNSHILMPKETKVSKAKEIPKNGQKAAPKPVDNQVPQSMLYWLIKQPPHQVRNMILPPPKVSKVSKAKEIPSQKAAPKPG